MMLTKTLPVAIVFAAPCALSIVDVITAACSGSICRGNLMIKGSPSFTDTSENGSEKTDESNVMLMLAGALGSWDTARGFEWVNFNSRAVLVASTTSMSTREDESEPSSAALS